VPEEHALALSFLHNNALAKGEWAVQARPELFRTMDLMPEEAINARRALSAMPPLIKGYLRLGGFVGDGAVVDPQFGTVDVSVVVVHDLIKDKYSKHYHDQAGGKTDGGKADGAISA
jgi:putative hemolysin